MAAKPPTGADRSDPLRSASPWLTVSGTLLLIAVAVVAAVQSRPGSLAAVASSPQSSLTTARGGPSASVTSAGGPSGAARSAAAPTPGPTRPPTPTGTSASQAPVRPTSQPTPTPHGTPTTAPRPTPAPTPRPTPPPGAWPKIGHIYEIILENHEFGSIIGSGSAPYINSLATKYGLATRYYAVSHPSLPNYLALWSGSTQGVKDDGTYNFTKGKTIADQIEASGRTWHVAAEDVPLGCFTGATTSGGYARKHEPAISWTSVSGTPGRCANITDFPHFNAGLGNFWFIVPNLCHDMHDCSVATGDAWLKGFLPKILGSAAYKSDGLVIVTFDEGSSDLGGGGKVATIVISPKARTGFSSSQAHSHYSLVRTVEALWGMPCLANSCSANTLREFFP